LVLICLIQLRIVQDLFDIPIPALTMSLSFTNKDIKKTQTKEFIKDTEKTKNRLERERLLQGF